MKRFFSKRFAVLSSVVVSLVFPGGVFGVFVTFSEGGDTTPASILDTVNSFRAALGDPNNGNAAGNPLGIGRREINWDGGGSATTISLGATFDGFLNIRGARFTTLATPGAGFVQAPPDALDPLSFGLFSPLRIFSPIGSNITDVSFFIPGTGGGVPATVSGFGAVFTDVNRDDPTTSRTTMEFFDISNKRIFNGAVPIGDVPKQSLSFLGAAGDAGEEIYRVRITTGVTPFDLVAMDDFIYAEPKVLPESGGIVLMVLGLGSLLFYRRSLAVS